MTHPPSELASLHREAEDLAREQEKLRERTLRKQETIRELHQDLRDLRQRAAFRLVSPWRVVLYVVLFVVLFFGGWWVVAELRHTVILLEVDPTQSAMVELRRSLGDYAPRTVEKTRGGIKVVFDGHDLELSAWYRRLDRLVSIKPPDAPPAFSLKLGHPSWIIPDESTPRSVPLQLELDRGRASVSIVTQGFREYNGCGWKVPVKTAIPTIPRPTVDRDKLARLNEDKEHPLAWMFVAAMSQDHIGWEGAVDNPRFEALARKIIAGDGHVFFLFSRKKRRPHEFISSSLACTREIRQKADDDFLSAILYPTLCRSLKGYSVEERLLEP